jgi:Rieske Fe-S protein
MKRSIQIIVVTAIVALISLSASCGKGSDHDSIPNIAVDVIIDVNSTMYINLNMVGGYEYLTGGYKGLVVYRVSNNEFVAYDRACSHDPLITNSRLEMDNSSFVLQDTVCGSSFLILDGSVVNGPATLPLKRYNTSFDGSYLRIYN